MTLPIIEELLKDFDRMTLTVIDDASIVLFFRDLLGYGLVPWKVTNVWLFKCLAKRKLTAGI